VWLESAFGQAEWPVNLNRHITNRINLRQNPWETLRMDADLLEKCHRDPTRLGVVSEQAHRYIVYQPDCNGGDPIRPGQLE
jgi:hypothetical protein